LTASAAAAYVEAFRGKHVVVVGDVMLDEYVRGDVARVSPEAPVPVVDLTERSVSPGGAANAAANVLSLGGRASIVGLIGEDALGVTLRDELAARGIDVRGLVTDARPTTHKLRIVARMQQIVRVDVESRESPLPDVEAKLEREIVALAEQADAVIVSDYGKGVVSRCVARAAVTVARRRGLPVVVDPNGRDYAKYAQATVVTPNVFELEVAAGVATHNVDAAVVEAGVRVLPLLGGASLVVTRGARGMTLLSADAPPHHLPTLARSVFDVTGAGDTVVGTLTLALACGVPLAPALELASHAAGIAVARAGTVSVRRDELLASVV
jgi:D-beta-D-heptose 7-phosphate kinase/D-beta-D-heptose 1-phosphate adenosyltransferase